MFEDAWRLWAGCGSLALDHAWRLLRRPLVELRVGICVFMMCSFGIGRSAQSWPCMRVSIAGGRRASASRTSSFDAAVHGETVETAECQCARS